MELLLEARTRSLLGNPTNSAADALRYRNLNRRHASEIKIGYSCTSTSIVRDCYVRDSRSELSFTTLLSARWTSVKTGSCE